LHGFAQGINNNDELRGFAQGINDFDELNGFGFSGAE